MGGMEMARPLRITYPGAFYHVTSRGNELKRYSKAIGITRNFLHIRHPANAYSALAYHLLCTSIP